MKFKAVLLLVALTSCAYKLGGAGVDAGTRPALVQEVEVLQLESYPVQIHARILGAFRTTCEQLADVTQRREGETFFVTLTVREEGERCAEVLVPFEKSVALKTYGLPPGPYTVNVNGVTQTFILP